MYTEGQTVANLITNAPKKTSPEEKMITKKDAKKNNDDILLNSYLENCKVEQ